MKPVALSLADPPSLLARSGGIDRAPPQGFASLNTGELRPRSESVATRVTRRQRVELDLDVLRNVQQLRTRAPQTMKRVESDGIDRNQVAKV